MGSSSPNRVKLWASAFGGEIKSIASKYSGSQLLQKVFPLLSLTHTHTHALTHTHLFMNMNTMGLPFNIQVYNLRHECVYKRERVFG